MTETTRIAEGHPGCTADDQVQPGHCRVGKHAVRKQVPTDPERQQHQGGQRQAEAQQSAFGAGKKRFTHSVPPVHLDNERKIKGASFGLFFLVTFISLTLWKNFSKLTPLVERDIGQFGSDFLGAVDDHGVLC